VEVSRKQAAAPSPAPVVGEAHRDSDVGDILKTVEEHLKRFTVSVRKCATVLRASLTHVGEISAALAIIAAFFGPKSLDAADLEASTFCACSMVNSGMK
jgi:hypothetical protein